MSEYTEFYLKSRADVIQYETIEIYHSKFSRLYRVVRNSKNPITVILESGTSAVFEYYPLQIRQGGQRDNLDYSLDIDLGDLGDVIPKEIDRVRRLGGFSEKPKLYYRTYRSDTLTAPLFGPIELEVSEISFNAQGCSFTASPPVVNALETGIPYRIEDFPGLRAFV